MTDTPPGGTPSGDAVSEEEKNKAIEQLRALIEQERAGARPASALSDPLAPSLPMVRARKAKPTTGNRRTGLIPRDRKKDIQRAMAPADRSTLGKKLAQEKSQLAASKSGIFDDIGADIDDAAPPQKERRHTAEEMAPIWKIMQGVVTPPSHGGPFSLTDGNAVGIELRKVFIASDGAEISVMTQACLGFPMSIDRLETVVEAAWNEAERKRLMNERLAPRASKPTTDPHFHDGIEVSEPGDRRLTDPDHNGRRHWTSVPEVGSITDAEEEVLDWSVPTDEAPLDHLLSETDSSARNPAKEGVRLGIHDDPDAPISGLLGVITGGGPAITDEDLDQAIPATDVYKKKKVDLTPNQTRSRGVNIGLSFLFLLMIVIGVLGGLAQRNLDTRVSTNATGISNLEDQVARHGEQLHALSRMAGSENDALRQKIGSLEEEKFDLETALTHQRETTARVEASVDEVLKRSREMTAHASRMERSLARTQQLHAADAALLRGLSEENSELMRGIRQADDPWAFIIKQAQCSRVGTMSMAGRGRLNANVYDCSTQKVSLHIVCEEGATWQDAKSCIRTTWP